MGNVVHTTGHSIGFLLEDSSSGTGITVSSTHSTADERTREDTIGKVLVEHTMSDFGIMLKIPPTG